jgi:hypothetical protein
MSGKDMDKEDNESLLSMVSDGKSDNKRYKTK